MALARREPQERASLGRWKTLERGTASWVTLVLVLGIAAGAYAAVVFVPVWVLHYEVQQVVRDYGNQAVKNKDDAVLLDGLVQKIRSLQQVDGLDEAGRKTRVPVIDLNKQEVTWERIAEPPSLHVEFEYPRVLELPWLDRRIERVYRVNLNMDLKRADWGPAR